MSAPASFVLNYLLNSLWQLPLLFLAGLLAARLLRRVSPVAEHRVWVVALLLQALLPACSIPPASLSALLALLRRPGSGPQGFTVATVTGPGSVVSSLHLPGLSLSLIATLYTLFLLSVVLRFLWRAFATFWLQHEALVVALEPEAALFWTQCSEYFLVRAATLATSPRIGSPLTLGVRRKQILLPAAMLDTLSLVEMRTVVSHEFAHMHRQDFLKNVLYEIVSLPVSYHPFLLLARARLQQTREIVCDQLAAKLTGRRAYAQSLLRLASLLVVAPPPRALHAIGILDAYTFERRLMFLTTKPIEVHGMRRALACAACAVLTLATCSSALALRVSVHAAAAPPASASAQTAAPDSAAPHAIKVSGGVMAGNILSKVAPVYPPAAKAAKIQGTIVLQAVIGKDGLIKELDVVSGPQELRDSAFKAVHQWTYKPFLLNGAPVEVQTSISVTYTLG